MAWRAAEDRLAARSPVVHIAAGPLGGAQLPANCCSFSYTAPASHPSGTPSIKIAGDWKSIGGIGALLRARAGVGGRPGGRIAYRMKRPLPDGTTHLLFTGLELLRRVASLVPPPRTNLTRFHGVFAPGAKLRPFLVPKQVSCGGRRRVLAYVKGAAGVRAILEHLGLPTKSASLAPARAPPQAAWC
jgi:LSD1 subclass zinc finger protein